MNKEDLIKPIYDYCVNSSDFNGIPMNMLFELWKCDWEQGVQRLITLVHEGVCIILSLLLSSNFITAALVVVIAGVCWFIMSRKSVTVPLSNQNPSQPTQPATASTTNTPTSSPPVPSSDDIDVKVAVAEVEHSC